MEPIRELQSYQTFCRQQVRWLERFVSRLTAKRDQRIAAKRAELSASALRLLVAMETDDPEARVPGPEGPELPSPRAEATPPHDWTAEEHAAAARVAEAVELGEVMDAEYAEVDEADTSDMDDVDAAEEAAEDCQPPALAGSAEGEPPLPGWTQVPVEPLPPGAIITVDESKKVKRERPARRA